jgi:fumarate hydratase class II
MVFLQSMRLLGDASESFRKNLVVGIKPREEKIAEFLEKVQLFYSSSLQI